MTNEKLNMEDKIEQTMARLDDMPKMEARHGFFDRLDYRIKSAKLQPDQNNRSIYYRFFRPVLTSAAVACSISIGILIGSSVQNKASYDYMDLLVDTYNMNVPDTYGNIMIED